MTAAKDGTRVLASVAYDALSRRASVSYDNGSSVSYAYTARGDLTDHNLSFTGGAAANYDYAYNGSIGAPTPIDGQLISRSVSDPTFNWLPLADGTDAYAVNGLNQYTSIGGVAPVYDGNGNITTDHKARSFTYDAENVLRVATGLASGSATYRYHADGSRREKTAQGATTQFYYMGGLGYLDEEDTQFAADQEIAEYSGSTLLRRYVRLPGSIDETFLMIDATLSGSCTLTSYAACEVWAQTDRIGSVVATADSSGAITDQYRYSPYGVSGWEGEAGFPFRFTGQKLDPETGLYYYKARYYDPEVGRFLQTDPIGYEDQMNLYAYVGNDPVNSWDPSGMCTGSRITNDDGTCISTGGYTTGLDGYAQGLQIDQAIGEYVSQKVGEPLSTKEAREVGADFRRAQNQSRSDEFIVAVDYVARLQAQGGMGATFAEESVVLVNSYYAGPITSEDGIEGLMVLWATLSPRQQQARQSQYLRAQRFILGCGAAGGCDRGRSFSAPGSDVRIDVEILRGGIAFIPGVA